MATGRMIRSQISISEDVNDLSVKSALLFTWMITHADDFGRMYGSARKIKALVVPMRDDFSVNDVEKCLREIDKAELIIRYKNGDEIYIQFPTWEDHQTGLHKRTESKFPEFSGNSRKFPEIPGNVPLTEQNRTEENVTEENVICDVPPLENPATDNHEHKQERNQDPYWDSLVVVFGKPDTEGSKKLYGKVRRSIKATGCDPTEIIIRANRLRAAWGESALTINSLETHWPKFAHDVKPLNGNNSRASPNRNQYEGLDEFNRKLDEKLYGPGKKQDGKTIDIDLEVPDERVS